MWHKRLGPKIMSERDPSNEIVGTNEDTRMERSMLANVNRRSNGTWTIVNVNGKQENGRQGQACQTSDKGFPRKPGLCGWKKKLCSERDTSEHAHTTSVKLGPWWPPAQGMALHVPEAKLASLFAFERALFCWLIENSGLVLNHVLQEYSVPRTLKPKGADEISRAQAGVRGHHDAHQVE